MRSAQARGKRETGSLTAEMVVLTPLIVLVLMLVVAFGRLERTAEEVSDAAGAAAQEAVVWPTTGQAYTAAQQTAASSLGGNDVTCSPYNVSLDTSQWDAGGSVAVTVSCTVTFADVAFPGVPGSYTLNETVDAPIETYRSVE